MPRYCTEALDRCSNRRALAKRARFWPDCLGASRFDETNLKAARRSGWPSRVLRWGQERPIAFIKAVPSPRGAPMPRPALPQRVAFTASCTTASAHPWPARCRPCRGHDDRRDSCRGHGSALHRAGSEEAAWVRQPACWAGLVCPQRAVNQTGRDQGVGGEHSSCAEESNRYAVDGAAFSRRFSVKGNR